MSENSTNNVGKAKGSVAWYEREIAKLEAEYATLPSVGYHRARFLEVRKRLRHMREALDAAKQELAWFEESADAEKELDAMLTPEERVDFENFMKEQDARARRDVQAEKRRDAFKVIDGGRVEE